jgi:uncharacterized protein YqjF (DUF2071 family)
MNTPALRPAPPPTGHPGNLSRAARARMLGRPGEPLLIADWDRALMVHYEVDPAALRPFVPFPLDLHEGRAYVTLLAFTMRGMKPRRGGRLAEWLFHPIATHGFLNVRTYVKVGNETGIYFLAEHLDNRLSLRLGPPLFGLPYRLARLNYEHDWRSGEIAGRVTDPASGAVFSYRGLVEADESAYKPAEAGSLTAWLMERYTAFTVRLGHRCLFRVWHPPWLATPAVVKVREDSLLRENWPWFAGARLVGANFSPGLAKVWMGRPLRMP